MGKLQTTDILQLQMFLSEKKGTCILDFRLFAPSFKKKKGTGDTNFSSNICQLISLQNKTILGSNLNCYVQFI